MSEIREEAFTIDKNQMPRRRSRGHLDSYAQPLFDDISGDKLLHNLIGTAVDAGHAAVSVGARDVVLPHVARAAVHLHALVSHL